MAQMTIYLDNELESKVKQNVAWFPTIHQLAGAWDDFPDADTFRHSEAHDCARESF